MDDETREVTLRIGDTELNATVGVPPGALGLVLFAHGSGSSRFSPRNRYVASVLQRGRLATLLMDLLTSEEEAVDERTAELRFDIPLLAERLVGATDVAAEAIGGLSLPMGYFGASTGAAAALVAAAERPDTRAVVSRGGRPDLAGPALRRVHAPTLLIVGGRDQVVLELNRKAQKELAGESELLVVPGATHLFEEPGALESVADAALHWFLRYLPEQRP
ncbi:MAG TPA: hydrolase [Candidatus Dormibacteraeota bacterium]|nr:hydrolase [Candidatus Dormibacteraeota bacterium]